MADGGRQIRIDFADAEKRSAARTELSDVDLARVVAIKFCRKFGGDRREFQSIAYISMRQARDGGTFDPWRARWSTYATRVAWNAMKAANLEMSGLYRSSRKIKARLPTERGNPDDNHELLSNVPAANPSPTSADLSAAIVDRVRSLVAESPAECAAIEYAIGSLRRDEAIRRSGVSAESFHRALNRVRDLTREIALSMGWHGE